MEVAASRTSGIQGKIRSGCLREDVNDKGIVKQLSVTLPLQRRLQLRAPPQWAPGLVPLGHSSFQHRPV